MTDTTNADSSLKQFEILEIFEEQNCQNISVLVENLFDLENKTKFV